MLFVIGVAGPSAAGKSSVVERIVSAIGSHQCALLCLDSFYHGLPPGCDPLEYDFDSPNAFDFESCAAAIKELALGKSVSLQSYDYVTHQRCGPEITLPSGTEVLILEGILTFYHEKVRELLHLKVFVDEDADVCLCRRIQRDVVQRGRSVESVLAQYEKTVKPALDNFINPQKRLADIIIQRGVENVIAIDLLVKHIAVKLEQRGLNRLYTNLHEMPLTGQVRALHTCFRRCDASRDQFIFYVDRMIRLLVEEALNMLPFQTKRVTTPTGEVYQGFSFSNRIAAISVSPGGEAMEHGVREVIREVRIGKVAVVASADGNRMIEFHRYPPGVARRKLLILLPVLDTGATLNTVLTDLARIGCMQSNMIVLSLIASPEAIAAVCGNGWTNVRLVVSAVDRGVNEQGLVVPGIGWFAERYFGTERFELSEC
ncbi:uridine kinase [Cyanidioschyzon merolae strain 10D]|jgi:uridine kinase|uniref:uridine/cytidine kinase n=1 Tax=Cyanidioschyzon merolae (strain NIES-3377 / 10D) TaxID=280699 RepID=M1V4I3_CYAM1|nr:uridine kinase [Cyanidioschyzon merolae strain 10D]BAM79395.1 uridine kinase [Cyanidioschyzon merolae strain 10D]|eukprot:XP_005535681.1 uridine kinase [Cyanidioschyzon merolae strain 10D]